MLNLADVLTPAGLATLGQVIMIDLMLAGDNAVVLGTLAAGLPPKQRKQVLAIGIGVAMVLRVAFAVVATQLLQITGLLFAGGLLLLWVAWKLYRELRASDAAHDETGVGGKPPRTLLQAAIQVAIADLSMSLDNVLAVAGAARDHPTVLLFGLILSVALMAVAANFIAKLIERYRWIAYLGLLVILYVAGSMIYHGIVDHEAGLLLFFR
ncbi:TerC family protein [Sphingomonas immobilis]|uniref:TerC family protein n=1 Tax=Sphingomonas immobilis TaxID=3063997 RepID=A0ABT8ZV11_9SPHN|nr:TerC family protein [Sphingomonas sp. CA1-15]MDO7841409.1 TerC family protein [Sphingomonas sp. CA1-15]